MHIHPRLLLIGTLGLATCAPLSGATSATVLAPDRPASARVTGDFVEEETCSNWLLTFFFWGDTDGHEGLVGRVLERTGAHALVDAEATTSTYGFPYVYMRECSRVRGRPARFDGGAR